MVYIKLWTSQPTIKLMIPLLKPFQYSTLINFQNYKINNHKNHEYFKPGNYIQIEYYITNKKTWVEIIEKNHQNNLYCYDPNNNQSIFVKRFHVSKIFNRLNQF